MLDVLIIGAGPAGLSAALVLARCRRRVVVLDGGPARNHRAAAMNGFLTRDRIAPAQFLALARADVRRYGVKILRTKALDAMRNATPPPNGSFRVLAGSRWLTARKLLLATGVRDVLPEIDGLDALYGTSVHHCPYCDGWEHRDRALAAYGKGSAAVGLALALKNWSADVVACTDGVPLTRAQARTARNARIPVREEKIARLESRAGRLRRIHFHGAPHLPHPHHSPPPPLARDALFFNTAQHQRSDLPRRLGCQFRDDGGVATDSRQATGVPGLYLAGDADKDVQFVIVAAAEGAVAATAINRELQDEG